MKDIKLVVFDLDQTVINSKNGFDAAFEKIKSELQRFLEHNGIDKQVEHYSAQLWERIGAFDKQGQFNRDIWWNLLLEVLEVSEVHFTEEESKQVTQVYWDTTIKFTELYPDTLEVLNYLKGKYTLGLLTDTDGTPGIKQIRLERSKIIDFFDGIMIAGEDVPEIKPDPNPFLKLAEHLGISPPNSVMVGDKPFADIKGGKAAGFHTILILRENWEVDPTPDYQINHLKELKTIL